VPTCNVEGWGKQGKTHKSRGIRVISSQTWLCSVAVFSLIYSVCWCARLCFFTTRLHCQSVCLIGCTPARTTTLSSSPWCFGLPGTEERMLSEPLNGISMPKKAPQQITDFCQSVMTKGICRRKRCFVTRK